MATGTTVTKNLAEYFGASEDTIYLSGMAAGAATKKGVIGYVVPFAIPEVIRHANAFALGAQLMHPERKGQARLDAQLGVRREGDEGGGEPAPAGADVLGQNVDTPAAGQYAESKKIPWVGYNSDSRKFAPTSWLTAAIYDWGVYYVPRVKAAINGTWKTGFYYGTIKDGFTASRRSGRGSRRRRRPRSRPSGPRSSRASSTSSPGRSTTRRASSASRRARS